MDFPLTGEIFRALREDTNIDGERYGTHLQHIIARFCLQESYELLIFGENHDTNRMYEPGPQSREIENGLRTAGYAQSILTMRYRSTHGKRS